MQKIIKKIINVIDMIKKIKKNIMNLIKINKKKIILPKLKKVLENQVESWTKVFLD